MSEQIFNEEKIIKIYYVFSPHQHCKVKHKTDNSSSIVPTVAL